MTTVVYDGKFLAADKMGTYADMPHQTCERCEHVFKPTSNDSVKIIIAKNTVFRGETINLMAGSGHKRTVDAIIRVAETGCNLEEAYRSFRIFDDSALPYFEIMLIGETRNFLISRENKKLMVTEYSNDQKLSVGSGDVGAYMAMQSMQMDAVQAIREVIKYDVHTGGDIDYVDTTSLPLKIVRLTKAEDWPRARHQVNVKKPSTKKKKS